MALVRILRLCPLVYNTITLFIINVVVMATGPNRHLRTKLENSMFNIMVGTKVTSRPVAKCCVSGLSPRLAMMLRTPW